MAKSKQAGEFLLDGIGPLDAGMNSGLAPQLISNNQVSMSTNMTFRGGYGTHRPLVREIALDFKGDDILEDLCIHKPFQGASFYQPDTGAQSVVAAIGGKLFQFFPDGTTATVLDISVPNDPNPTSPQQAWLWQAERFIIWNDGVSLPVFFDGSISRRSNGPNKVLAAIAIAFTSPAVGATVNVTVTETYTGPFNVPVLVNGFQYNLLGVNNSASTANLTLIYDPFTHNASPTPRHTGDPIVAYANRVGTLLQDIPAGTKKISVLTSNLVDVNNNPFGRKPPPFTPSPLIQLGNRTWFINNLTPDPIDSVGRSVAELVLVTFISTDPGCQFIPSGSLITIVSSAPNPIVGKLTADFTAPLNAAVGYSFDISMAPTYTGPPQVVWIGTGQYLITAIPPTTSSVLILQNTNDTAGHSRSGNITALPELGPGRMAAYGMGRNWMALTDGRSFVASDIVGGPSGTAVYNFRDSVLRVTENNYLAGGGNFIVPGALGDIRLMKFSPTLDVSLGQGPLQIFTTMAAFSCNAPVDRTTWSTVTNPILTQSLIGAGALSQSGGTTANGDIIFRSIDGIRSLILARRDFDTWGNVPQSREVETILAQDNATLVQFESLVEFDNRLLLTILPTNGPLGVFHQGIIALNEDPISTLRGKAPSIYDGLWTGLNVLQFVTGIFNGVSRCYAFCFDSVLSRIRLFELQKTDAAAFDNDTIPVTYSFESASLFKNPKLKGEFELAELMDGQIYISDIRGVVNFEVWWKNNYSDCWNSWITFGVCGNNIDSSKPLQYRAPLGLGTPPVDVCDVNTKMPARIGLNFQVRIQITGSCKFRGGKFKAVLVPETRYSVPLCKPLCDLIGNTDEPCEQCADIVDCLKFPLVLYNLNANRTYQNDLISVEVTCPDNSVQIIVVPAGTITYTLPFSPGFTGIYPPLVMNCLSGGVIVRNVPSGATQNDIDLIIGEMISQCVQAYARSIADCSSVKLFSSEQVTTTHTCPDGELLQFSGTLPSWISIDENTWIITGNAGAATSEISVEDATAKAQQNLENWVNQQVTLGNLACHSSGPTCPQPIASFGLPSDLDWILVGTRSAATRLMMVQSGIPGYVKLIDSATNTVIATTVCTPEWDQSGEAGCFATSTGEFYLQGTAGCIVFNSSGALVATIAPPASSFWQCGYVYSAAQDKVYGVAFSNVNHKNHIIEINPHTHAITNDVTTAFAATPSIYYSSGQDMVILHPTNSYLYYSLPALANLGSTFVNNSNSVSEMDYDPNTNRLFCCIEDGGNNPMISIDPVTFAIDFTYNPVSNAFIKSFVKYNPVTGAIIAAAFNGEITVIDPVTQTIICEFTIPDTIHSIAIDYFSGDVYFMHIDSNPDGMTVYR